MLKYMLYFWYIVIGASLGIFVFPILLSDVSIPSILRNSFVYGLVGALLFLLLFSWSVPKLEKLIKSLEDYLMESSLWDIIFATVGMVIGLLITVLISSLLNMLDIPLVVEIIPFILAIVLGYLGFKIGLMKVSEVFDVLPASWNKSKTQVIESNTVQPKIIDTSAVIDGRIIDVVKTGFLDGKILIPQFVIDELQLIADATDSIKRDKGQRGLDLLNELTSLNEDIKILNISYEKLEVDQQLIDLAKEKNGVIITTDYNLNKVCQLHHIKVLNVNELSDAIKLNVLKGDKMDILISKAGKEENQGVGYLEDGTMVVVDDAKDLINEVVKVEVTSVLQTNSGRIVFTKKERAL